MSVEAIPINRSKEVNPLGATYPRIWPAVLAAVLYWAFYFLGSSLELSLQVLFFSRLGACAAAMLFGTLWWWTNFRIPLRDRALVAAAFVIGTVAAAFLSDVSVGGFGMYLFGIPVSLTACAAALLVARRSPAPIRRNTVLAAMIAAFLVMTLVRMNGVWGNAGADFSWRWSPTSEDQYMAERGEAVTSSPAPSSEPIVAVEGDWIEFRGPHRAGAVQVGAEFRDDWKVNPPQLVWKRRVGPAWSSMTLVAGRLFTQEQHGENEAVVCYDAASGEELWNYEEPARYWDQVAGAGPRATPTFHEGRIYALGAKGLLVCLDAATGALVWRHETLSDEKLQQMWGFASSPLIVGNLVVVYGGGEKSGEEKRNTLVAVNAATGERVWATDGGQISYASAQLSRIGDRDVLLFASDLGVQALEPESGKLLWSWGEKRMESHAVQPHVVQSPTLGDRLLWVTTQGFIEGHLTTADAAPTNGWISKHLKPEFCDFVVYNDHAYGFDGDIFTCVNLKNGKRTWKQGRYGSGQVILLEDKAQLLVLGEKGQLVLLAADPKQHQELGKIQAIEGKTWNHAIVAHGRIYVRNAEEMACFDAR